MVEMELLGVRVEMPANTPLMLLREKNDPHRVLPIYIGHPEALAIASVVEGVEPQRPMTHDLFRAVLERLSVSLDRVVVTEMRDHTFYAELELTSAGGTQRLSSRPSDAVALAVRTGSPIYASAAVLDELGQLPAEEAPGAEQAEELVDEFRHFIDQVSPEDFA